MSTVEGALQPERLRRISPVRVFLNRPEFGAVIGAVLVFLVFAALGRGTFTSEGGIAGWLQIAAQIGILGATVSLLMIAGEFDLSVGSMVGAAGLCLGLCLTEFALPLWLSIAVTFAFALSVGAINGYLVVRTGLPSFLVTLATLLMLRGASIGITRQMTGLTVVSGIRDQAAEEPLMRDLFTATLYTGGPGKGSFNMEIVWWLAVVALATWLLLRTSFGNWIFAVGGSATAARNVGVPVRRVKITLFMLTAASAALLACIQVLSVGSADVLRGQNKEFEAIITAVVGGTLMTGGYGSALGSMFGALILGMTNLGIIHAGINADWYFVVLGGILLLAVLVNDYFRRRSSESRR